MEWVGSAGQDSKQRAGGDSGLASPPVHHDQHPAMPTEPCAPPAATLLQRARQMPKVLLHEHLDGGLRMATLLALPRERGIAPPNWRPPATGSW